MKRSSFFLFHKNFFLFCFYCFNGIFSYEIQILFLIEAIRSCNPLGLLHLARIIIVS